MEAPGGEADAGARDVAEDEVVAADLAHLEAWDVDGDGVLLRDEFDDGFAEWGVLGEIDADGDGVVSDGELADGIFARYDDDLDGIIEEPELTDIGDDMGDGGFWDV